MKKPVLSISIPTYNRKETVKELVYDLLSLKDDRIEIVVTDNISTDDTYAFFKEIKDERLKVFQNKEAVPGLYNMIVGLFNASGNYVLHCNDRDLIFVDKLQELINFLESSTFSFVQTSRDYGKATREILIYEKGYDSLMNQNYTSHPTGMVFNADLMHSNLDKIKYLQYINEAFTYCFLMRDLVKYEKSAKYDIGCWNERHSKIKISLKSGSVYKGGLYFEPDRINMFMKSVVEHITERENFNLTDKQKIEIVLKIISYFKRQLTLKKICYSDKRVCIHYGIKRRKVGYIEQKKIYMDYIKECTNVIKELCLPPELEERWLILENEIMKEIPLNYIKAEKAIFLREFSRRFDPQYPY